MKVPYGKGLRAVTVRSTDVEEGEDDDEGDEYEDDEVLSSLNVASMKPYLVMAPVAPPSTTSTNTLYEGRFRKFFTRENACEGRLFSEGSD